jgi:hypothetical protein
VPTMVALASAAHLVHLHEEKVFAQLGEKGIRDFRAWICDTGATNHMSGSRAAFAEMDAAVRGTVRFGDDSVAEIEGRSTVELLCKDGERRRFAGVYYIPRLTANIVSVGQLDEAGFDVHIKGGRMDIRELGGGLLARVERQRNRLYVLNIDITQTEECMTVRTEAR